MNRDAQINFYMFFVHTMILVYHLPEDVTRLGSLSSLVVTENSILLESGWKYMVLYPSPVGARAIPNNPSVHWNEMPDTLNSPPFTKL